MLDLIKTKAALFTLGGIFIAFIILGAWGYYYKHSYETEHKDFEMFKAITAAEGKLAKEKADQQKADDIADKEKADNEHKTAIDKLNTDSKRLRDNNANISALSSTKAITGRPEITCFDTAKLDQSLGYLIDGVSGIVIEGQRSAVDLDNAKLWAN